MSKIDFKAFDADNHYYEAEDAFIRHVPKEMHKRCMQWADLNGKKRLLVGGAVNRFIPNPTFNPIARPGSLDDYFRGKKSSNDIREAFGELKDIKEHPEYRDRDARVELMEKQNLEAAYFFPTLGVGMESALANDLPAMRAAFKGFNRWLAEDWGFSYKNKIFAAPYISLSNVEEAVAELDWALEHDCRLVNLRASAVLTENGNFPLGHPRHDAFWKKANDAGIVISFHSGDAGYDFIYDYWGLETEFQAFKFDALKSMLCMAPVADTIASLMSGQVLTRFPNLRVATIETGSQWVKPLFQRMEKAYKQQKDSFTESPLETFRRQVWVAPFYEDDLPELADLIGESQIIFGSDYPHAEGLETPTSFVDDLEGFSDESIKKIMRDNGLGLLQLQSA